MYGFYSLLPFIINPLGLMIASVLRSFCM